MELTDWPYLHHGKGSICPNWPSWAESWGGVDFWSRFKMFLLLEGEMDIRQGKNENLSLLLITSIISWDPKVA